VEQETLSLDHARWTHLWARLGAHGAGHSIFDQLVAAYGDPVRAYHNIGHLRHCLMEFDRSRSIARHPDEVEAALWFHDAVYVPGNSDNEVRSARLAETALTNDGVPPDRAKRVAALILATRHLEVAEGRDAQLVCDIDLSILGSEPSEFDEFERLIRREYAWVPQPIYRSSRAAVLGGFLRRPSIYQSPPFMERYERQARRNLERAVATWTQ